MALQLLVREAEPVVEMAQPGGLGDAVDPLHLLGRHERAAEIALGDEGEILGELGTAPPKQQTVAERLAALLAEGDDTDEEEEADEEGCGLMEEAFEEDE